ncbi:MAG: hypothetical protein ACLSS9_06025 [Acutalibacteraceae bacterium]
MKLDHGNGIEILYAHCSGYYWGRAYTSVQETVARWGGDSNGFHLHTEVR